jgi:imidazoleglycerol-phosphate dehydratase/histidinol-phosphatase
MKKVLFIDRDGTLIVEPPEDYQVDSLDKLEFYPGVFRWLSAIASEFDYELVMVSNQDGLGTDAFPLESFFPPQNKMLRALENEGIFFTDILIDPSLPSENSPNRKPGTGMLGKYIHGPYNLEDSWVIGDRFTDVQLAANLGCNSILLGGKSEQATICAATWEEIYRVLKENPRNASGERKTSETQISISLNLDGKGESEIDTGLKFFDHMLEQIAKHGQIDLYIKADGDLQVDEHHTIEDTGLLLGELFRQALGLKKGIERYGFLLPMDDSLARVALDFGGRPWLEWNVEFKREKIGDVPTEMFHHFFKSFTDNAKCNLNISASGENEHHKIESVFKAFAKSIKMAVRKDAGNTIPSTKGSL